jgi:hypothetical protein
MWAGRFYPPAKKVWEGGALYSLLSRAVPCLDLKCQWYNNSIRYPSQLIHPDTKKTQSKIHYKTNYLFFKRLS